jgi:hypothetical protein
MQTAIRTEAKRAFVLADRLKSGPFDSLEVFQAVLAAEKSRVAQLSDGELDSIIARDPRRLQEYNKATWNIERIMLGACFVYPKMGGREWARGSVCDVAEQFKRLEPLVSRIWMMKHFSGVFEAELPIMVFTKSSNYHIDDGSHRAIAMWLCRIERIAAWVGEL